MPKVLSQGRLGVHGAVPSIDRWKESISQKVIQQTKKGWQNTMPWVRKIRLYIGYYSVFQIGRRI